MRSCEHLRGHFQTESLSIISGGGGEEGVIEAITLRIDILL